MFGFLGKVLSNLLGFVVALALMIGGCLFVGTAALKGVAEAQKNGGGGGVGNPIASAMDAAEKSFAKSIAQDLIDQYNIVQNGTDEMAKSMRAGAVAEAYLQAKDSAKYETWKAKADAHLKKAMSP